MSHPLSNKNILRSISLVLGAGLFFLAACIGTTPGRDMERFRTPLEGTGYQKPTSAASRSEFLRGLAEYDPEGIRIRLQILGKSVENRPIEGLYISLRNSDSRMQAKPLRILLLGTQHGNEISGCEALLMFAGRLISRYHLAAENPEIDLSFLIIPAVNPDGIENKRRVNAQGINLSTDYGLLKAPESTAVARALLEFKPHVVLDIHESALLKKKSLGAEGWLTDFEAQFEFANNPNVDTSLQAFTSDVFLPELLRKVNDAGLRASRYIGEITSTRQILQHGGLSAHNFRNRAGLGGAASFLLENRLDVSTGIYPTPRNIRERVRKQMLCIDTFLSLCRKYSENLILLSEAARRADPSAHASVWLQPTYTTDPKQAQIDVALRARDTGERVMHRFDYRGIILNGRAIPTPKQYRFVAHLDFWRVWLSKQGIEFTFHEKEGQKATISASVDGENGLLLPLYLEPVSASSIVGQLPFAEIGDGIERASVPF